MEGAFFGLVISRLSLGAGLGFLGLGGNGGVASMLVYKFFFGESGMS